MPPWAREAVREHRTVLAVVVAYLASGAFLVPAAAPVAISDDWTYARSVEILLDEGRVHVLGVAAANALPQVFWGAAFAAMWGELFGGLRIATVVFTALSGVMLAALCRDLGVSRPLRVLAVALYLFAPLTYVLSFTFLTDPYLLGFTIAATWLTVRAVRPDRLAPWLLAAGSGMAALAYLQRQQGLFLPVSVLAFLLLSRRLPWRRGSLLTTLQVMGLPLLAVGGHAWWSAATGPERFAADDFVRAVLDATVADTLTVVGRMAFLEALYLGLFVAALALVALWRLPHLGRRLSPGGWWVVLGWHAVLVGGLATWASGRDMPYLGPYVNREGVGPSEIRGARPPVLDPEPLAWVAVACAVASLVAMLAITGAFAEREARSGRAGLVAVVGAVQAAACMLPSFHFLATGQNVALDRYLAPLVPFAVVLLAWALREVRLPATALAAGGVLVVVLAAYAVVGTRDYLVFQEAVWDLASDAVASGVPLEQLDGGYPWVGYHLHEVSLAAGVPARSTADEPFWTAVIAPVVDPVHVIAQEPIEGYGTVLDERPYRSLLDPDETSIVLLRRDDDPPAP